VRCPGEAAAGADAAGAGQFGHQRGDLGVELVDLGLQGVAKTDGSVRRTA
jgi:hypothetical protein